jgi:hypothetical protein
VTGAERQRRYRERQKAKVKKLERAVRETAPELGAPTRDEVLDQLWAFARDESLPGASRVRALELLLEHMDRPPDRVSVLARRLNAAASNGS